MSDLKHTDTHRQKVHTEDFKLQKLFSVKDYVCLVTGGGTGIGLMAAQSLAANGARVYITSRRGDVLSQSADIHGDTSHGGSIIALGPCDVSKKDDLERLCAELSAKEDHLDLLVCAAGISGTKADPSSSDAEELKRTLWSKESPEAWGETYNTDVTAVYFTTVAFLPLLAKGSKAKGHFSSSVIVISSMSGIMRHAQAHFSYNVAKGAAVHLSKIMAKEFERTHVRVNSIAPGYFPSEMTAKDSDDQNKSELPEEQVLDKGHEVPAQRAGSDMEMAMAVLFLAKNTYVNGEILAVDGGVLNQVGGR